MYRVDILTDFGIYTAIMNNSSTDLTQDVKQYLSEHPKQSPDENMAVVLNFAHDAVIKHLPLFGWTPLDKPTDVKPTPFTIEGGAVVQHIKAYIYTDSLTDCYDDTDDNADKPPTLGPRKSTQLISWSSIYLGQNVDFKLALYVKSDLTVLILPYLVNNQPAITQMKASALTQQIDKMMNQKQVPATKYDVVIPDFPLTEGEALEYLEDYANETPTKMVGGGKAKAWHDWGTTTPRKEG